MRMDQAALCDRISQAAYARIHLFIGQVRENIFKTKAIL